MVSFENTYFNVSVDESRRIVKVKRTPEKFPSIESLEGVFADLTKAVKGVSKSEFGLLIDLRSGPFRNDEAFETTVRKHTADLVNGWRKAALLVKTAVGELQISRQARETGNPQSVFRYEHEAIKFLEC